MRVLHRDVGPPVLDQVPAPPTPAPRGLVLLGGLMALAGVGVAALAVAVATGAPGGSQAAVDVSAPAEPLTRWGLPVLRVLRDLGSAAVVGLLVLLAVAVPAGSRGRLGPAGERGARVAAVLAVIWLPLALATSVLRFAEFAGLSTRSPALWPQYADYLTRFPMGRAELVALVSTAALATLLPGVRTLTGVGGGALLAAAAVLPLAATGHASAGDNSETAVVTLAVHLLAAAVWVGGLLAVLVLRAALGPATEVVVRRFSRVAAVCWAAVALSGGLNLVLALHDPSDILSVWGAALVAKAVLLAVLGAFGWAHRRWALPRFGRSPGAFRAWAAAELVVMALTLGTAVGVTAAAPPPGKDPQLLDMPWVLLGYPSPPALTPERWLTAGRADLLWGSLAALLLAGYLLGVRRHRGLRGPWPSRRTAAWTAGCVVLLYATSGAPGLYGRVTWTASVAQVLLLALVAGPLLAAGHPGDLASRTLHARSDASRGPREWAALVLTAPMVRGATRLGVALPLLVALLAATSISPLLEVTLRTWIGRSATVGVALAAGSAFAVGWSAAMRRRSAAAAGNLPTGPTALLVLGGALALLAVAAVWAPAPATAWYTQVAIAADPALLGGRVPGAAVVLASAAAGTLVVAAATWAGGRTGARHLRPGGAVVRRSCQIG